jgi:hypothetical protein
MRDFSGSAECFAQEELARVACSNFGSWATQALLDRIDGQVIPTVPTCGFWAAEDLTGYMYTVEQEQLDMLRRILDAATIIRLIRDPHGGEAEGHP